MSLPAGAHVVTIAAQRSEFGDTYEVDETRVVNSGVRLADESQIDAALESAAGHVAYAFDLGSPGASAQSSAAFEPVTSLPGTALAFWAPTDEVTVSPDVTEAGAPAADVAVPAGRDTYAAVQHSFTAAQNWSHRADVFLDFDGTDSGLTYQVVVTFSNGAGDAYYTVKDDSSGWRTIALSTDNPAESDNANWSDVTGIRIALPSKELLEHVQSGCARTLRCPDEHRRGVRHPVCNRRDSGAAPVGTVRRPLRGNALGAGRRFDIRGRAQR